MSRFVDSAQGPIYLCRDEAGVYAMTAICTHAGCTIGEGARGFVCPCHGSSYDFNGANTHAPAPLVHFRVCVDATGRATIDPRSVVPPSVRA
jgi:Rieske Fe-S protein